MLVDLGRNDLGKICDFGTVEVEKYMSIERYSHVMHIGSTVKGQLRKDKTAVDAIDSVLPAGTLSGAPKLRACQIINELENNKRGIYGGAIGYLDFTGNMDTCIAIRLAFKEKRKSVRPLRCRHCSRQRTGKRVSGMHQQSKGRDGRTCRGRRRK